MRSATKTFVGLAGIGVLVATAKLGLPTATATAATVTSDTATTSTTTSTTDTTTSNSNTGTKATTTTKKSTSTKKTTTTTKKSTGSSSSTGTTTTPTTPTTAGVSGTKTGSAFEPVFGSNIQLSVTKVDGKITDVTCVVCEATGGRRGAFPGLIQAAVSANGTNFGNMGGATYTTSAFKKALKDAIAKF